MEVVKGVIQNKGVKNIGGKPVRQYTLVAVILTDEELPYGNQEVLMGVSSIMEALDNTKRFVPPKGMGDAENQLISVSSLTPEDLDVIED